MRRFLNQRRRVLTAEETAANAKARADREAASMTCQCCGMRFLANMGSMAHHGYQRPGMGWQTSSCMGAKFLPFEVSRTRLGDMIQFIQNHIDRLKENRAAVVAETAGCPFEYSDRTQPKVWNSLKRRDTHPRVTVQITRANFEEFKALFRDEGRYYSTFEEVKAHEVHGYDSKIALNTQARNDAQKRFDGWKQTHEAIKPRPKDGPVWRAI